MPGDHGRIFQQHREEAFDTVIALIGERIGAAAPALLPRFDEMSVESLRRNAVAESWSLFLRGIRHLKDGAPGRQPGSMTEALSRASLRSCAFAASLGVRPPQFEQMYFSVGYTTGRDAAFFFCRRLAEAAEGDLSKSRQIIHLRIMTEKPADAFGGGAGQCDIDALKKQMVFSFNVLAETYGTACRDFRAALLELAPPDPAGQGNPSPRP